MPQNKPYPPDEICNPNWDALLKVFHAIPKTHKDAKTAKKAYSDLQETAKVTILTERQREGIIDRCAYQIGQIDNPTKENTQRIQELEQFQKMRAGKFSKNGQK